MTWTVAPIASNDPAAARMLRGARAENDSLVVAARDGTRLLALHVFAPIDVLIDHARRRLLRLAASIGEPGAREDSLPTALRCAATDSTTRGAAGVCALVGTAIADAIEQNGFRAESMHEIVFPLARRRAPTLDPAAAFDELGSANLVRFDYHALGNAAHRGAPVLSLERNNNFVWGVQADGGAAFDVRGCELNHPQLFPELLAALGARYGVRRARFLCSRQSMLGRAARGVRLQDSPQSFVHKLESAPDNLRFDAHAGLACSRH